MNTLSQTYSETYKIYYDDNNDRLVTEYKHTITDEFNFFGKCINSRLETTTIGSAIQILEFIDNNGISYHITNDKDPLVIVRNQFKVNYCYLLTLTNLKFRQLYWLANLVTIRSSEFFHTNQNPCGEFFL